MENQRTQTNIAMNYGFMFGLTWIGIFLLFYFMGTDPQSSLPKWISNAMLVIFIVYGIKNYRDKDLNGFIGYGKSLGTGVLISICGGMIAGIFTMIFFHYIAPEMKGKMIDDIQKNLVEQGMSDSQIEKGLSWTKTIMSPLGLVISSIIGMGFMGFIFSLIISIFLRKEQNPFNTNIG